MSLYLLEDLGLLDYFNALKINVCKLSLEGFYVARNLHFMIISFEKFYHVGRYWFNDILLYFGWFYAFGRFLFYEISLILLVSIFMTNKIHK